MAANTSPIFGRTGDIQVGGAVLGPTAVTAQDGTGTLASIFQADTTEGSWVDCITLKPVGSPAATVIRIFMHCTNGAYTPGTTNTAANTSLIAEVTVTAVTTSNTVSQNEVVIPIRKVLNAGYRLLFGNGTSTGAAGTGYSSTTWALKL